MDHNSLKFMAQLCKQLCQHKECGVDAKTEEMEENNFLVRKCQFKLAYGQTNCSLHSTEAQ